MDPVSGVTAGVSSTGSMPGPTPDSGVAVASTGGVYAGGDSGLGGTVGLGSRGSTGVAVGTGDGVPPGVGLGAGEGLGDGDGVGAWRCLLPFLTLQKTVGLSHKDMSPEL